jgi:hypothetical protein
MELQNHLQTHENARAALAQMALLCTVAVTNQSVGGRPERESLAVQLRLVVSSDHGKTSKVAMLHAW